MIVYKTEIIILCFNRSGIPRIQRQPPRGQTEVHNITSGNRIITCMPIIEFLGV